MSYQKIYKNCSLKLVLGPSVFAKTLSDILFLYRAFFVKQNYNVIHTKP